MFFRHASTGQDGVSGPPALSRAPEDASQGPGPAEVIKMFASDRRRAPGRAISRCGLRALLTRSKRLV